MKKITVFFRKYSWTSPFSEGLAPVYLDDGIGFIDKTGKVVIPFRYQVVDPMSYTDLGILFFKTALQGLEFELNMPANLINMRYNSPKNEYVLCVQPTKRQYIVTITCAGYELVDFKVKNIVASQPHFFRINPN